MHVLACENLYYVLDLMDRLDVVFFILLISYG